MMASPARIAKGLYWDRAWSLVEGCTPVSEACRNCWSAAQTHMRAQQGSEKMRARYGGLTSMGRFSGSVRLMRASLELPLRVRKPTTWAIWNDLFHTSVPFDFIAEAFHVMCGEASASPMLHAFVILTKRPERMRNFFAWLVTQIDCGKAWLEALALKYTIDRPPSNIILGVTAENQATADERTPLLLETPAAVRAVSYEPALGPLDLSRWASPGDCPACVDGQYPCGEPRVDWVACGAESGPRARPMDLDWARSVRDQCIAADIPFFLKQIRVDGKLVKMPELDGRVWDQFPSTTRKTMHEN